MLNLFELLKVGFYLIVMIGVAIFGLQFSFYGLMVTVQNSSIYQVDIENIEHENLKKNRYLQLNGAFTMTEPLIYVDEHNNPEAFIYALTDSSQVGYEVKVAKILVESS